MDEMRQLVRYTSAAPHLLSTSTRMLHIPEPSWTLV